MTLTNTKHETLFTVLKCFRDRIIYIFLPEGINKVGGNSISKYSVYNWSFKDSGSAATDIKAGYTDSTLVHTEGDNIQTFLYEGSSSDFNKGIVFQVVGQPLAVGLYSGEQVAFSYFRVQSWFIPMLAQIQILLSQ